MRSYADMLIQLARCKFYTVGPLHTVMSAILYWYAPVSSKRPVGERLHSHSEPVQNRFKTRMVRNSEPDIGPIRKRAIPFPYEQKRQIQFRSTFRTCWVSTGAHKCISLTLSQYIRETLFSSRSSCVFFRHKLLNFNLSEPPNSFFEVILPMFFLSSSSRNFLPFDDCQ